MKISICNHKEYKNSKDCPLCYPKYDERIEGKIRDLYHKIDKDDNLIKRRTLVMLDRIKRYNSLVNSYGGGVRVSNNNSVAPKTAVFNSALLHHAKKNIANIKLLHLEDGFIIHIIGENHEYYTLRNLKGVRFY